MKKGEEYTAVVDYVNFPNKGIVKLEGEKIAVKGVLPGQEVKFQLKKAGAGKKEGRLLEVVAASEREGRIPPCPHFGKCGGCAYQTMPYTEQLRLKEEQVRRLLEPVLRTPCTWEGFGYRNKMEYSFGDECKDGPLTLGLHKKGSFYDVVTAESCCIVHSDFGRLLAETLDLAAQYGMTYYHKLTHQGYLRHLLVRRAVKTGEMLVHLVTSSGSAQDREKEFLRAWESRMKELTLSGSVKGIIHIVNDHVADAVLSDRTEILCGDDFFSEELLGLKFKISTFSFFQTNSLGAEVLYEKVREYVGETGDRVVFDLYSGTGTIAQLLAPVARKVIGVEIVEEAVLAARENAARNGLENCEFLAGDVLRVLDEIRERPELIVLDPPRDGIHPKALQKIISYGVEQLVYISCKPTSLARDLVPLQEAGYEVKRVCLVDMFPQTVNVETVCLLSKLREAKHRVSVTLDMDEIDLTSAESKAIYGD